jgi:hypothetical protein
MSLYNGLGRGMSVFGGAEENLVDKYKMYKLSAEADAKRQMVKKLCEVFKGLKFDVPDFPTSDDPVELEQCADQLKEVVAKRLKRGLKEDEASREKVCRLLAREINNIFGGQLIDTSLGVESVCASVTEFCLSFARGLHLEYFTVQADVKKSITNCELLIEVMNKLSAEMDSLMADTKDGAVISKYSTIRSVYSRAGAELTKQMHVLENLMNVKTMDDPLKAAFKEGSDLRSIVESLGIKTSDFRTGKYADNIVQILLGLTTVAEAAARVHSALKKVGMTAEEYRNTPTMEDLKKKLSDLGLKQTDFALFKRAGEVLEKNFDPNSADWKAITGGVETRFGLNAERYDEFGNPNFDSEGKKISSMEKQLKQRTAEQRATLEIFAKQLNEKYNALQKILNSIVPKLGKEIKLTDKTNAIRTQLRLLQTSKHELKHVELSLIGAFKDAKAMESREQYLSALTGISRACVDVSGFEGLIIAIDDIHNMVDHFYDTSKTKFGGADDLKLTDMIPKLNRSALTLTKTINEFVYYYYLAQLKHNYSFTSAQVENQSEEYVKLLGAAVANRLNLLRKAFASRIKCIRSSNFGGNGVNVGYGNAYDENPVVDIVDAHLYTDNITQGYNHGLDTTNKMIAALVEKYKKISTKRISVLENFYAAIQAIDLYLKEFTIEITQNPEKILELKTMLQETEMINNWFNEKTGNDLCDFFSNEYNRNGQIAPRDIATRLVVDPNEHYYETLKKKEDNLAGATNELSTTLINISGGAGPGYFASRSGVDVGDSLISSKKIDKVNSVIENFSGFKNLISIFAKIGDIGNKKVFMSTSQILSALTDFMKESSVDYGRINVHHGTSWCLGVIPSQITGILNSYGSLPLKVECDYFKMAIKAMVAKVMTTIGLYDIMTGITPINTITTTRIILGGAEVEPIAEAAEIYFRLPRLIEYYRDILKYTKTESDNDDILKKITLIPELKTVFGPLLKFIFKLNVDKDYMYSDQELRTIVFECNRIYNEHKSCQVAIEELVKEVNSRFGMVKRDEIKKYYQFIDDLKRENETSAGTDPTNFQLFKDEDDKYTGRAPSSMYELGDKTDKELIDDRTLLGTNPNDYKFFTDFQDKINESFSTISPDKLDESYNVFIVQSEQKLKTETDSIERLKLAYALIQNAKIVNTNTIKLQLFKETVITGLDTLANINHILDRFMKLAHKLELAHQLQYAILNCAGAGPDTKERPFTSNNRIIVQNGVVVEAALDTLLRAPIEKLIDQDADSVDKSNITEYYSHNFITYNSINCVERPPLNITTVGNNLASNTDILVNSVLPSIIDGNSTINQHIHVRGLLSLMTKYDKIMTDLLEGTFEFVSSSQSLVSVEFTKTGALFNYTKLRNLIDDIFTAVKSNLEKFKPYIPSSILSVYIDSENVNSLYWLEEKLRYNKFDNRQEDNKLSFDKAVKNYNLALLWLLKDNKPNFNAAFMAVNIADVIYAVNARQVPVQGNNDHKYKYPYGEVLKNIVYKFTIKSNVVTTTETNDILQYIKSVKADGITDENPDIPSVNVFGVADTTRIKLREYSRGGYYKCGPDYIQNCSLLQMLNQLIEKFIMQNAETSPSLKIYSNLISSLCSGPIAKIFNDPQFGLPDTFRTVDQITFGDNPAGDNPGAQYFVNIDAPRAAAGLANDIPEADLQNILDLYNGPATSDNLLVYSLIRALQVFMKRVLKNTNIPTHLITSLTDVPSHIKEQLRCNLPYFSKLFNLMVLKCEFLTNFINDTNLNVDKYIIAADVAVGQIPVYANSATVGLTDLVNPRCLSRVYETIRQYQANTSITEKQYLLNLLQKISNCAFTLVDSCDNVLKELGDTPIFGQLNENFIEMYTKRYKNIPVSPFSFYNDILYANLKYFTTIGTDDFKNNYMARGLNGQTLTLDVLPYEKHILEEYNAISSENEKIIDSDFEKYLSSLNLIYTLFSDIKMSVSLNIKIDLEANVDASRLAYIGVKEFNMTGLSVELNSSNNSKSDTKKYDNVVTEYVEKHDDKNYSDYLSKRYSDNKTTIDRKLEWSQNIIDMNIIPFNIHMLMRDIPLVNIYNYSYTFDKFMEAYLQVGKYNNTRDEKNTKQLFYQLLKDPYVNLGSLNLEVGADANETQSLNLNLLRGIFVGDDALGMGRPKFLSDQLYNKVLIQSVYNERHTEEMRAINTSNNLLTDEKLREGRLLVKLLISETNKFKKYFDFTKTSTLTPVALLGGGGGVLNVNRRAGINRDTAASAAAKTALSAVINMTVTHAQIGVISAMDHGEMISHIRSLTRAMDNCIWRLDKLVRDLVIDSRRAAGPAVGAFVYPAQHDPANVSNAPDQAASANPIVRTAAAAIPGIARRGIALINAILPIRQYVIYATNLSNTANMRHFVTIIQTSAFIDAVNNFPQLLTDIDNNAALQDASSQNITADAFVAAGANRVYLNEDVKYLKEVIDNSYRVIDYLRESSANNVADPVAANVDYTAKVTYLTDILTKINEIIRSGSGANMQAGDVAKLANNLFKSQTYTRRTADANFNHVLSYVDKSEELKYLEFSNDNMQAFDRAYAYRFNSYIVRNLFFITNINRVLRQVFEKELTGSREVIKHGYELANAGLTEYGNYPMKPNETYPSKQGNGLSRLANSDNYNSFYSS